MICQWDVKQEEQEAKFAHTCGAEDDFAQTGCTLSTLAFT